MRTGVRFYGRRKDGYWDAKLASPQNAAGAIINDIIAKHVLTS